MPLSPGTRLGRYEVVRLLGAGGMGEVYLANDTQLDRTVAIKVLPEHLSGNVELRQRFEREARAVSSLNHPHICTLYDVGHEGEVHYLVMEHLEGETLVQRLRKGALPTEEALSIAVQIADALDKAHRQGVVHRDLKPGNIMLTKSGAKLLDFGLAKQTADAGPSISSAALTQTSPLTAEGTIVGTFQYMSPEQLEGKEADARTDLFAFGAAPRYRVVPPQGCLLHESRLHVKSLNRDRDLIMRIHALRQAQIRGKGAANTGPHGAFQPLRRPFIAVA